MIPKSGEVLSAEDVEKLAIRKMNEIAYSKLILSIDTTQSGGKVAFSILKGSKSTDYKDGNANKAWKGLKAKYLSRCTKSLDERDRNRMSQTSETDSVTSRLARIEVELCDEKQILLSHYPQKRNEANQ